MAMSHLLEQGYRKIGHISGPSRLVGSPPADGGLERYPAEAGLDANDDFVSKGIGHPQVVPWRSKNFIINIRIWMRSLWRTIKWHWVSCNFSRKKRFRIPEDIGIVGFDNIAESAFFSPPLTTVQQDQYHVAQTGCCTEIIKIIEAGWQGLDPVNPSPLFLPPTLIVRQSSLRVTKGGEDQGSSFVGWKYTFAVDDCVVSSR